MNVTDAARQILKKAGKPLSAKEIARRAIKAGLWSSLGKQPWNSVSACIYTDVKRNGEQSSFVKHGHQIFSFRDSAAAAAAAAGPAAAADAGMVKKKRTPAGAGSKVRYSFLNAAEKVLDQFADRKSMHYRDITKKAFDQGWLNSSGKTPEAIMNALLVTNLKRARISALPGRFTRTSSGYYGLLKWVGTGLPNQIFDHNKRIRRKLLSHLMDLAPAQFEELVGQLLAKMGFESIEETKYGGDGDIDVRGTLLVSEAIRIKMVVQVKRWTGNITNLIVQNVRDSLDAHEQGLIITTGDFSPGAINEANQPTEIPVGLMNKEQLLTLLMEHNIGVRRELQELFEIEELPVTEKAD